MYVFHICIQIIYNTITSFDTMYGTWKLMEDTNYTITLLYFALLILERVTFHLQPEP